jgi:hypothetical protein
MTNKAGWLSQTTQALSQDFRAKVIAGATHRNVSAHVADFEKPDPTLTVWQRTCSTVVAEDVSPRTGAAIVPRGIVAHGDIPRAPGWRKVLRNIAKATGCRDVGFVFDFLLDVEFQSHQSTSGRWDAVLKRFRRYGVRSVADWLRSGINDGTRSTAAPRVSERSFRSIKNKLVQAGLIEASTHLWKGRTCLWIRPADRLSRMLFEDGFYASLLPAPEAKEKPRAKPRGLSALHAQLDEQALALYRQAITGQLDGASEAVRWAIWHQLTKPVAVGKSGRMKGAFAPEGSYRRKRLHEALGLSFS